VTEPASPQQNRTSAPAAQAKYQVRFDWGTHGATAVAGDADIVVWVDVLPPSNARDDVLGALEHASPTAAVILGGPNTASAVAAWILEEQVRLGRRAMVSVLAAGEVSSAGVLRFAVEDQLGAGAVIDALASRGIDYTSPEAAAACAAFMGLRGAVAHLLTASVSGQEAIAAGRPAADISGLGRLDTSATVAVLRAAAASE
jgi:phosphosulfolactate phosphohydrolase-like enzyme